MTQNNITKIEETNNSLPNIVEDLLDKLNKKIKRLNKTDGHTYEIQFLEYLQTTCIHLADYRNQIVNLLPYYQNEIKSDWDSVTNTKMELEIKKKEVEDLKKQVDSIQSEGINLKKGQKNLSNRLKKQESVLNRNHKNFNKNAKQLEKSHSKLEMLSQFEKDTKDTFITQAFDARNKFQTRRLNRLVNERENKSTNLAEEILKHQSQVTETVNEIKHHQGMLQTFQQENINLREEIQRIMILINKNTTEMATTEKEIEKNNKTLEELSVALVGIASETSRQHSIYKKTSTAPLDDMEYTNFLEEAKIYSPISQNIEEIISNQQYLLTHR